MVILKKFLSRGSDEEVMKQIIVSKVGPKARILRG
jgi:hypothetical protein